MTVASDARELLSVVAAAAHVEEGVHGVEEIVRHLGRTESAATRWLSRRTGIPVPVVAAVCAELRRAGLVASGRPARLTGRGRELADGMAGAYLATCACEQCRGQGFTIRPGLRDAAPRLASMVAGAPPPDPTLDQSHCTIESKLRRIAYMEEAGALGNKSVLLLGDDDLMGVAIVLAVRTAGMVPPARLVVLDIDSAIVEYTRAAWARLGAGGQAIAHDLRLPLPAGLELGFDAVLTDPPYTQPGGELFMSRAAQALGPGPGRHAFCSFGPKSPDSSSRFQHAITGMGFSIHRLIRNFNDYAGAGVLAGTSHLYHLITSGRRAPSVAGTCGHPIYTGELRAPGRLYVCRGCGTRLTVGRGQRESTIGELQRRGCPTCGGHVFRPGSRRPA